MNKADIRVGQSVHYAPEHGLKENGVVKSITDSTVFVVYNCGGEWHRYMEFTGCSTNHIDLLPGWATDARNAYLSTQIK
jgi:hypothetical protein